MLETYLPTEREGYIPTQMKEDLKCGQWKNVKGN